MRKVVRDGKVAVLYGPSFGGGWSTGEDDPAKARAMLFDPDVVAAVEAKDKAVLCELVESKGYDQQWDDLTIRWLPEGTRFRVHNYDGSEQVITEAEDTWWVA